MLTEDIRHPEKLIIIFKNQKSRSLSSKTGRKKYKRWKKETKEVGRELRPGKGVLKREKVPTPGNTHC